MLLERSTSSLKQKVLSKDTKIFLCFKSAVNQVVRTFTEHHNSTGSDCDVDLPTVDSRGSRRYRRAEIHHCLTARRRQTTQTASRRTRTQVTLSGDKTICAVCENTHSVDSKPNNNPSIRSAVSLGVLKIHPFAIATHNRVIYKP